MKQPDLIKLGKFLSLVLRHKPEMIDIQPDPQGWVDITTLLRQCRANGKLIDRPTLQAIVATNNKKRYSISEDGRRIRAHQGHSIPVVLDYESVTPPDLLYHGTAEHALEGIFEKGLVRQKRHHVHLSRDLATASQVGLRHGKLVILAVDAKAMHRQGHEFFCTPNDVWLTDAVPVGFLRLLEM